MAFPVVESTNNWNSGTTSATSHNVGLPSGIQAGDLLVLFYSHGGSNTAISTPSGWTSLSALDLVGSRCFYKIADGTEGSTVTITTNANRIVSSVSYRITGTTNEIEADTTTGDDPPNLTPSWGADDNLWITLYIATRAGTGVVQPTNYSNLITSKGVASIDNNNYSQTYTATRELNAVSENPGAWTPASFESAERAQTVAIRGISGFNPAIARRRIL